MAYEIISQNNTTTTLSDGTNTITVPSRVVLATGTTYEITEVNNSTATLEGSDGSVIRDVPCVAVLAGGGSGLPDQTGHSGEFLTTDGTDASWAAVDALPSQSGNSGKFLTTNGTTASWGNALKNTATGSMALTIDGTASNRIGSINIGFGSAVAADGAIQIGMGTNSDVGTVCMSTYKNNQFTPRKILDADGLIPTDRFTTTPIVDGTYVPTLTISSGTPTRSWAAPSGGLPSQTGNSGKFLTTDGTDASWSDKPLVNTATGLDSLTIGGTPNTGTYGVNIGYSSSGGQETVAVGYHATAYSYAIGIGRYVEASGSYSISIGNMAKAQGSYSLAIGCEAKTTANYAIQISSKYGHTNADANTFKVGNNNGNFELMSADGTIPTARLTKVNTTVTLTTAGWSSGSQTVTVNGVTSTSVVLVAPDPSDTADYVAAGILCTSQTTNSLTFTATTTPTNDIDVNIVCL